MRSRGYCFTINNYTDEHLAFITDQEEIGYRYIIVGFEVAPETGTLHLQGYVYFDTARQETSVRKIFYPHHIEPQRGTYKQAIDYCMKEGQYYENGDPPTQGKPLLETIEEVMKDPSSNFHVYHQYRKAYKEYKNTLKKDHDRLLYIVHERDKWDFMKKYESVSFNVDTYDEEQLLIMTCYSATDMINNWVRGYPEKNRRGYEIVTIDPPVIALVYSRSEELNFLLKQYQGLSELYIKNKS